MLQDPSYLKSLLCDHYSNLLKKKEKDIPRFSIETITGAELNDQSFLVRGFENPLLVESTEMLGLRLPPATTKLTDIADVVGHNLPVDVIEVGVQQQVSGCTIGAYSNYIHNYVPGVHKTLNMISMECSNTPLTNKILSPSVVRQVDWIDTVWPVERRAKGDFPSVQKYCLSGMAGSYTDFHVDFGGTSVWYHVLWGAKRFYLIPPTCENLKIYETWAASKSQETDFLGDKVAAGQCRQIEVQAGQTLMIPAAWIHSVYTPRDSLVFGGNYLHSYSILKQLQVFEIEQRLHVGKV